MSSTEPTSAAPSSSEPSAATPSPSMDEIPLITVSPRCIEGIQRSLEFEWRSSYPPPESTRVATSVPIPYFVLGSCDMDPSRWPATRCPKDYTSAYLELPHRPLESMVYNETLYCCPTAHHFTYREDYTVIPDPFTPTKSLSYYVEYASFTHQCMMSQAPISLSLVITVDPTTTSSGASPTPEKVTLLSSDIFVASPWKITYEVSSSTTCAPSCESPWSSGDPFSIPTPEMTPEPPPPRDTTWDMTPNTWILFVGIPLFFVVMFAGFGAVCCFTKKKEREEVVILLPPRYEAPGVREPPPPYCR